MTHTISLSFLTVFDAQPLDAIKIAAQTGYDALGLRLLPAAARGEPNYPLMTDNRLLMECRALLADTGLTLTDVEIVRLGADTNASDYTAFFERCAELGARHVVVAGDDSDFPRLIEAFSKLCEIAEGFDLTCDLEFMPWTGVKTLTDARDIVLGANAQNGGVLIDSLHLARSMSRIEDIATIPLKHIHYVQLCDACAEYDPSDAGMIEVARNGRLFPGEGDIDLVSILKAVPKNICISVEVPKRQLAAKVSALDRARLGIEAARRTIAAAEI